MLYLEDIADAVTAAINGAEWAQEFTAERVVDTTKTVEQLQSLSVVVHPYDMTRERLDQAGVQVDHVISIGIRQQLANTTNADVDPLNKLTQDMAAFFDTFFVAGEGDEEALVDVADTPILAEPSLLRKNLYLGVVRLTFNELN